VSLKEVIGHPYGSVFHHNNRKLELVTGSHTFNEIEEGDQIDGDYEAVPGDNSGYVDTNTAQKLTVEDITKLKKAGDSGTQIIQTLMDNSATFHLKTSFAQEKWIKRKEERYAKKLIIQKSTPASLCEASLLKNKEKICGMRYDSLAQVISQSGICSGSRVMVVESMMGMVVGSAAYRMRGNGKILAVFGGQQPHFEMLSQLNLDSESASIVHTIPSVELGPAAKDIATHGFLPEKQWSEAEIAEILQSSKPSYSHSNKRKHDSVDQEGTSIAEVDTINSTDDKKLLDRRTIMNNNVIHKEKGRQFLREGVDSLIIACRYHPLPLLQQALVMLECSCPFVIYHEFVDPLVECYTYLQDRSLALRMVLSETWLRDYQTLPGRFRPDMFMNSTSGFLLCGIYIGHTGFTAAAKVKAEKDKDKDKTAIAAVAASASASEAEGIV
jgi:tRNA (adenine-N(1)-)-methyltransferase non-catalytic subunit